MKKIGINLSWTFFFAPLMLLVALNCEAGSHDEFVDPDLVGAFPHVTLHSGCSALLVDPEVAPLFESIIDSPKNRNLENPLSLGYWLQYGSRRIRVSVKQRLLVQMLLDAGQRGVRAEEMTGLIGSHAREHVDNLNRIFVSKFRRNLISERDGVYRLGPPIVEYSENFLLSPTRLVYRGREIKLSPLQLQFLEALKDSPQHKLHWTDLQRIFNWKEGTALQNAYNYGRVINARTMEQAGAVLVGIGRGSVALKIAPMLPEMTLEEKARYVSDGLNLDKRTDFPSRDPAVGSVLKITGNDYRRLALSLDDLVKALQVYFQSGDRVHSAISIYVQVGKNDFMALYREDTGTMEGPIRKPSLRSGRAFRSPL